MAVPSFADEFDPFQLRSDASLNRTLLAAVAGADDHLVGRGAFGLLSIGPLKQLCIEHGFADDGRVLESIVSQLHWTGEPSIGDESPGIGRARAVCREYGRRLAHLIASLINPGASEPWNTWRGEYLRYWSGVDRIWLGGGSAAAFGSELARAVRTTLAQMGSRQCEIEIAPNPANLAVLGCARSRSDPQPCAISLDFGHSTVKRGVAIARERVIERLELLPPLAIPFLESNTAPELVCNFVLEAIACTYRTAQQRCSEIDPRLVVSLATYLVNGIPVDPYSLYQPLGGVTRNSLEEELRRRIGSVVQLTFLHDGTAAARALPEDGERAAVIMLGTALGVGFRPPSSANLFPIAPDLVAEDWNGA